MHHIQQLGLDLIKQFEGFSPQIYICPANYPTIGYGHVVQQNEEFSQGISVAQAEVLLQQDVQLAEQAVWRLIRSPLTNNQFDALVSFTYNLGAGALQRSTLRRKINRSEHNMVPHELSRWVWAGGRKLPGLIKRRNAEAVLYMRSDT